jgi:hypothetical protein
MNFGPFTYLITTLIFTGIAILIEWTFAFKKLKNYMAIILFITLTGVIFTLISDPFALWLRPWVFNTERTFSSFIFSTHIESLIYAILGSIATVSATILWSDWEARGLPIMKTTVLKAGEIIQDLLAKYRKQDQS